MKIIRKYITSMAVVVQLLSCGNKNSQVKNMLSCSKFFIVNDKSKLAKVSLASICLGSVAYLAYNKYYCNKTAFTIFNQNTFICSKDLGRLKSYFFLIDNLFKTITKGTKKGIITLQEFPNYKELCEYAEKKAEASGYYFFSSPAGLRVKKNSNEKLCRLVILVDKNRFEVSKSCMYMDSKEQCKNVFAVAAKDKFTKENILMMNVKAAIYSNLRIELCTKFKNLIDECEKKFNKKFSKIIAPGDYNAFGDDKECTRDFYLNHFKKSMQSKKNPYFYSPFELHKLKVSFFPDWTDGVIRKPILEPVEELEKNKIKIDPYELSHIGNIIYKNPNSETCIKKKSDLKEDLKTFAFVKEKTLLKNVIRDIQRNDKIGETVKQLFINTISKIDKSSLLQDIVPKLNENEHKVFVIFHTLQKICARFENPCKLDIVNISSKHELITHTNVPNQLIDIDKLLACYDTSTKKLLRKKIIFVNKLFRYMPKPSICGLWDSDKNIETKTFVSDHFSTETTIRKKSILEKIIDLFYDTKINGCSYAL